MSTMLDRIRGLLISLLNLRYFVVISVLLFLIIIGTAFYLVYQNARAMRDQINNDFNQQQLILARQAASQIEATLQDIEVGVESLKRLMAGRPRGGREDVMKALFELTQGKGIIEIGLMDRKGEIVQVRNVQGASTAVLESIEPDLSLNGSPWMVLGPLRVEERSTGASMIISMFHTQIAFDDTPEGVLFAKVDVSQLVRYVTSDIHSGRTGYAWVIDKTGMFLYHPEEEFMGKNAFTARKERKPYISFTRINRIMKDRMLNGEEGTGTYVSGWHRGIQEGEITKLIAFVPVQSSLLPQGHGWSVAVVAPISEVAEVVHWVYVRHFATEMVLIAGLFVFGFLVVTYQQRMSRTLKERIGQQERYLSNVLQNSVDAIIFVNNDNRIQTWNRGAELIFEYSAEEMIGHTFHRLIPPEMDADKELEKIKEQAITKGYIKDYIAPRVTKSGRRITIDISRTLIRSEQGEVIGSTVIIKDVTDKTEFEQRIYNTEKLASIGILAAGVAHEINNPISIILGFTDLLIERFEPDSPEYKDLKIIEHNSNHAKKIVENLLGFARITEGLEDTVDINQSIDTVINIVKNTLMTKKIELVLKVPEGIPRVRGDTREFQQVIFNLINNSVAAMEERGGTLTLSARTESDWVHLRVADTGVGIPDKIKPRIFDPFFTTKTVGGGTGLGLSLCYGIVKKYGGKINFSSVYANDNSNRLSGTTFTVSIPVHLDEPEEGGN